MVVPSMFSYSASVLIVPHSLRKLSLSTNGEIKIFLAHLDVEKMVSKIPMLSLASFEYKTKISRAKD